MYIKDKFCWFAKAANRTSSAVKKDESTGFSIVELILSIIIGGLFIVALTQIINNYISLGQKSRNVVLSNSYLEGKIESLRNIGFSGLSLGSSNISSELPTQLPAPKNATMDITSPSDGLKKVDISITYNDKGQSRTYSYTTYIGELSVVQ